VILPEKGYGDFLQGLGVLSTTMKQCAAELLRFNVIIHLEQVLDYSTPSLRAVHLTGATTAIRVVCRMMLKVIGQFVILSFGVLGYQMGVMVNVVLECTTVLAAKDGSRAGLEPKPAGFRPDGGGRGSIFPPRVCGFGYPTLCGGGGGSKIPPRVTRGPRSIHFNPKMESSPTAN
jgi:hypothetical protein